MPSFVFKLAARVGMTPGQLNSADRSIANTVRKPQDLLTAHSAAMRLARGLANAPYQQPLVKSAVDVPIATLPVSEAQLYTGLRHGQQWAKVTYPTPDGRFIDALVFSDAKPTPSATMIATGTAVDAALPSAPKKK